VKSGLQRGLLAAIAWIPAIAVALALLLQHGLGMQPCAWCTVQRLLFLAISASGFVALALARFDWLRRALLTIASLLAAGGVWAAMHQHWVAAQTDTCGFTAADRFLLRTGLDEAFPALFAATASCREANLPLLGVPFALWSALLFCLLAILSVGAILGRRGLTR
jgi:protein dithiol:quinone oxidoreductase